MTCCHPKPRATGREMFLVPRFDGKGVGSYQLGASLQVLANAWFAGQRPASCLVPPTNMIPARSATCPLRFLRLLLLTPALPPGSRSCRHFAQIRAIRGCSPVPPSPSPRLVPSVPIREIRGRSPIRFQFSAFSPRSCGQWWFIQLWTLLTLLLLSPSGSC
jgi:hypothetical protein